MSITVEKSGSRFAVYNGDEKVSKVMSKKDAEAAAETLRNETAPEPTPAEQDAAEAAAESAARAPRLSMGPEVHALWVNEAGLKNGVERRQGKARAFVVDLDGVDLPAAAGKLKGFSENDDVDAPTRRKAKMVLARLEAIIAG